MKTRLPFNHLIDRKLFPFGLSALLLASWAMTASAPMARGAPSVASVTPANGATNVSVKSPLVFTFDQVMDTDVPAIMSIPPFVVGNVEVTSNEVLMIWFEWGADGRSLIGSFDGDLPANTTIDWRLNPPGMVFPLKSAGGVSLPLTTGSFTTGSGVTVGEAPTLVSSNPPNGDFDVPLGSSVSFTFDQPMTKTPNPGGNPPAVSGAVQWDGVDPAKFSYQWSADGTVLTCHYAGNFPPLTTVFWSLNPFGADVVLESATGEPLPSQIYSGNFFTIHDEDDDDCFGEDEAVFGIYKSAFFEQLSAGDPVADDYMPFLFQAIVAGDRDGPAPVSGSLTLPGGSQVTLSSESFLDFLVYHDAPATLAELEANYPAGTYTLRFTLSGQPEWVIPMNMPSGHPPTPKFTNFDEAQNMDVTADFTLRWNSFTGAGPDDTVSIFVMDDMGNILFPPGQCEPLRLPASATSVLIPANTLPDNRELEAILGFGRVFYQSTVAVPGMEGYGVVARVTSMPLAAGDDIVPGPAPRFTQLRLLPNGNPELTLSGTPGRTHEIQRSTNLTGPNPWVRAGEVLIGSGGTGVFVDTGSGGGFPVFYRALY